MRRILYVQYSNPAAYPPVERGAQILADAGFEVRLLGIGLAGAAMHLEPYDRVRVSLLPFEPGGWRQKFHYVRFAMWVIAWTIRWRPEWVYASDPLSCPVALVLKAVLRRRLVYHEHDSPAPEGDRPTRSLFMRVVLAARAAVAARADQCLVPTEARADAFRATTGRSGALTVWNCPRRAEVVPPRNNSAAPVMRVLFHGSVVPARLPVAVIHALARMPANICLLIAGYETVGHPGYLKTLAAAAAELGIASRVQFSGTLNSHSELMRHCATCDVGLALMPKTTRDLNERTMLGASNKPFDYLACGLAVLVSDLPDWRATYVDPGYGLSCDPDSIESIAEALEWFRAHPADRIAMGERGRRRILEDWNYESRFDAVRARIEATPA